MISLSTWLNNHKYELMSDILYKNKLLRIKDVKNNSKKLLKIVRVSELDRKVVFEVVSEMNRVNNINIDGLMKYKVIEKDENNLYQIMREYKRHLDEINPVEYLTDSVNRYKVLNGILMVFKSLYEIGTIHSDLKPSNIFLNDENEVVISDYLNNLLYKGREGMKQVGRENEICFVCIDELLGKELDISSDIWNFGLIFYYVMSGKYPFIGKNMLETMKNIENVKYIPLEYVLNSILNKILQKEKKNRMRLNEIISELKKLNEDEVPVIPFEAPIKLPLPEIPKIEEDIIVSERLKKKIDDAIYKLIRNNGKELSLREFKLENEGVKYLSSHLRVVPNIEELDISHNEIGVEGVKYLITNLRYIPNLKQFSINTNKIGNEGVRYLSLHLKDIPNLIRLTIYSNNIGVEGVKYLSSNLKDIPNLEWLYISYNEIGGEGARHLSSHFKDIPKLKQLFISYNKLGNEGMKHICSYLRDIPNLEWLDIPNNDIGDEGVKYFCENINFIPNLKSLNLSYNLLSVIGGEMLIYFLPKCQKMSTLWIQGNNIPNYDGFKRSIKQNHPNKDLDIH